MFQSGIFAEDGRAVASKKTGKVAKTGIDEVYFGNFGRDFGLRGI
jgi:hypothetical protein